ncbi:MAG TPA: 2-C-methyl-D-erythritol 2,4-cyclodiphosphate synthase [Opitutae bacterium]|nr:2-C-methyl-D-erythritol 2,4-cyclodiphosphate synthase [Opitutae bacterium]|tara:strand:+ start:1923 stop:2411 length:489 start_codon:yes stop_codon:yes gene_type:complete
MSAFRIGLGYDIHRLTSDRTLILGGVTIPHEQGLDGHSDADCLSHAIADAILGAAGLPDIGHFFPNTDPRYKGINSQEILKESVQAASERGYRLVNIDATLIAEAPKIAPHLKDMKAILSASLGIPAEDIGIKATTNEGIDDIGQKRAMAAHAVALLEKATA